MRIKEIQKIIEDCSGATTSANIATVVEPLGDDEKDNDKVIKRNYP